MIHSGRLHWSELRDNVREAVGAYFFEYAHARGPCDCIWYAMNCLCWHETANRDLSASSARTACSSRTTLDVRLLLGPSTRVSHVVLETVEPSKHRIAVPDHGELRIGTLNSGSARDCGAQGHRARTNRDRRTIDEVRRSRQDTRSICVPPQLGRSETMATSYHSLLIRASWAVSAQRLRRGIAPRRQRHAHSPPRCRRTQAAHRRGRQRARFHRLRPPPLFTTEGTPSTQVDENAHAESSRRAGHHPAASFCGNARVRNPAASPTGRCRCARRAGMTARPTLATPGAKYRRSGSSSALRRAYRQLLRWTGSCARSAMAAAYDQPAAESARLLRSASARCQLLRYVPAAPDTSTCCANRIESRNSRSSPCMLRRTAARIRTARRILLLPLSRFSTCNVALPVSLHLSLVEDRQHPLQLVPPYGSPSRPVSGFNVTAVMDPRHQRMARLQLLAYVRRSVTRGHTSITASSDSPPPARASSCAPTHASPSWSGLLSCCPR